MFFKKLYLFVFAVSLLGCVKKNVSPTISLGHWYGYMMLTETDPLHIDFNLEKENDSLFVKIKLDNDDITVHEIKLTDDSLCFKLPLYDSEFKLKILSSKSIEGFWFNYNKGSDYKIPFFAVLDTINFQETDVKKDQIYKRYKIIFNENSIDAYDALGLFKQAGSEISGTFATETGDYRYLTGSVINNEMMLNGFDGAHAYLFKATVKNDSLIGGIFLSGIHSKEVYKGNINTTFELKNADSITTSLNSDEFVDFKLPNAKGDSMTWSTLNLNNKVVIIQIMGSWCPNCYDETILLTDYYKKYKSKGLVILPIAFEATTDFKTAVRRLDKMYANTGIKLNYLIGGINDKKVASVLFPTLSDLKSFPTTIFIDKHRKTRRIHSGFYGPETEKYYSTYKVDTDNYILSLLNEP